MELADFRGHSDMVTCCALSNSGKFVVSSSEDNTVRVSQYINTCMSKTRTKQRQTDQLHQGQLFFSRAVLGGIRTHDTLQSTLASTLPYVVF